MISIRLVKPSEFNDVLNLIQDIFPDADINIDEADTVLLAEYSGHVVGFVHVIDNDSSILIQGLGVRENLRGKGIGTMLMSAVFDMIKDDCRPVFVKARALNPVMDLYARYGFILQRFGPTHVLVRRHNA